MGNTLTVGKCQPLSKTVHFNMLTNTLHSGFPPPAPTPTTQQLIPATTSGAHNLFTETSLSKRFFNCYIRRTPLGPPYPTLLGLYTLGTAQEHPDPLPPTQQLFPPEPLISISGITLLKLLYHYTSPLSPFALTASSPCWSLERTPAPAHRPLQLHEYKKPAWSLEADLPLPETLQPQKGTLTARACTATCGSGSSPVSVTSLHRWACLQLAPPAVHLHLTSPTALISLPCYSCAQGETLQPQEYVPTATTSTMANVPAVVRGPRCWSRTPPLRVCLQPALATTQEPAAKQVYTITLTTTSTCPGI
ncbi:hypothetical protein GH733_004842 [Mirounga leonina]|nr:hypothetical protein GH733_004842 [Mirounga leonina]